MSRYAGTFRPSTITIRGSAHAPVAADQVPGLIETFCDYINDSWEYASAVHLAAYALWRLNWVHPFVDGNGRTARIISYLILCAKLGYRLPGIKTIPEQIAYNKQPYYLALEAADKACSEGRMDVSKLEELLEALLATQLVEVHNDATGHNLRDRQAIADDLVEAATTVFGEIEPPTPYARFRQVLDWIEVHPALTSAIVAITCVVIAALLGYWFKT